MATNEGSYQHGYRAAISSYSGCNQGGDCPQTHEWMNECTIWSYGQVDNETACIHGYYHGWVHWCHKDSKDCAALTKSGFTPSITG
jgi:hypothetical protein